MFSIFAPTRAKAANPSQTVMKEKPMKRPRVPPKSATLKITWTAIRMIWIYRRNFFLLLYLWKGNLMYFVPGLRGGRSVAPSPPVCSSLSRTVRIWSYRTWQVAIIGVLFSFSNCRTWSWSDICGPGMNIFCTCRASSSRSTLLCLQAPQSRQSYCNLPKTWWEQKR